MEEFFAAIIAIWITASTFGAVNNMLYQTPDDRIITQCREQGYINVKQTVVTCSIEKEVKK